MDSSETTKNRQLVSLVLPAYNEEGIIAENLNILWEYLKSLEDKYSWEIFIINDGSSDDTGDLADAFAILVLKLRGDSKGPFFITYGVLPRNGVEF